MRIFLAGATGVIGTRLIPLLVERGHQVTGLTRRAERAESLRALGADPVVADVFHAESLAEVVRAAAPDLVMHQLTDLTSGNSETNAKIRTIGTRHLMAAARAAGVRKVVAQSIAWMYAPGEEPATEQTPLDLDAPDPRSVSVRGVRSLEELVSEAPEWVVLRCGLLYGPDTWYRPGGLVAEQARRGELFADASVSSFLHVDDAADAAVAALGWPDGPVNVCDDEPARADAWVPAFARWVGAPEPPVSDRRPPGWARGADNGYARKELGWTPRHPSWRPGFRTGG